MEGQKTGGHEERSADLREQVAYLRGQLDTERESRTEERRRHDTVLARLSAANAEQARTIRELVGAPSEAEEPAETVEHEPENAEHHSDASGAQVAAERPQQRSAWLASVDKLPWWHYALGLILVSLTTFGSFFAWQTMAAFGLNVIGNIIANILLVWLPPGIFGFWVGLRRLNPRFKSQVIPVGLLFGLAVSLGRVGQIVAVGAYYFGGKPSADIWADISYWAGFLIGPFLVGWLFYVSGVLFGNARQRRHTGRLSGTTPAPAESTTGWSPRQQAILGFVGTVIAALISLMGTIGSALVASGG
jgi:hypothetical protein